ncbi:Sec-independent protein translocase subunit TatA [Pseudonocardia humida]|uniref:Sec-independent protein translocase protein TatA n=1 Tax=Pseudonocardia humida TaxID=2800819 RepID=A0ABT0ZZE1_9PSEU|nr:Sec-independent protein translocase subunit TatA [Pseudonocardia humida]MCO1656081.1 Sec-independent protein translocase subunit TatA [Pseudonocardia humida]
MPNLGGWEFVILIGVLVLLFGAKRLPDMARSIGQSARVFKGEMKGMKSDEGKPAEPPAAAPAPAAPPAELPPPAAGPAAPAPATPAPSTQNGTPEASRAAGQGSTGAK